MKKFDSYKVCEIVTSEREFEEVFTNDWTFRDIESWMLDTFAIDKETIISMKISSVTIYKTSK